MSNKYHDVADGEPRVYPTGTYPDHIKQACCDCGLVHRVVFEKVRGGVRVTAWRDARATAAMRRASRKVTDR